MNRNTDTGPDSAHDPIDAWLAAHPVRPSADFASATLARIARERDSDDVVLDGLLASHPAFVSPGFTDRVLAAIAAARRRRLLFRVTAPLAAAACVAFAALPVSGLRRAAPSPAERVAAALAADPELGALAALPSGTVSTADIRRRDLAAFAELDAALSASSTEYAYGI